MSSTTAPTAAIDRPARVEDPELIALAEKLAAAADAQLAAIPSIEAPGARRRATKLATQLRAASRLTANGAHLEAPATLKMLERRADRAAGAPATGSAAEIDGEISMWRSTIVALHQWRGHTASVPTEE